MVEVVSFVMPHGTVNVAIDKGSWLHSCTMNGKELVLQSQPSQLTSSRSTDV